MPEPLTIIIQSKADLKGFSDVRTATEQTDAGLKKFATSQAFGLGRAQFSRLASGARESFDIVQSSSVGAGKEISDAIGKASGLATAFAFGGPIGAGLALVGIAIGAATAETNKWRSEADKLSAPYKAAREEIEKITQVSGLAKIAADIGVTAEQLSAYAKSGGEGRNRVLGLAIASDQLKQKQVELSDAESKLIYWQKEAAKDATGAKQAAENQQRAVNGLRAEVDGLTQGIQKMGTATAPAAKAAGDLYNALAIAKSGVLGAKAADDQYAQSLNDLRTAHDKAVKGFGEDWATAERKAAQDVIAAHAKASQQISDIQSKLVEQIGDMAQDGATRSSDAWIDYGRQVEQINHDIVRSQQDWAQKYTDLTESELDQEMSATTYAEVLKARRKADAARTKLDAEKKAADDENKYKLDQANAEYNLTQSRRDRDLVLQEQRAQRAADEQIAQTRRAESEQVASINTRKTEEEKAISARTTAEAASYTASQAAAKTTHDAKIKDLFDFRDENQKVADAIAAMAPAAYAPWFQQIENLRTATAIARGDMPDPKMQPLAYAGRGYASGTDGWETVPSGFANDSYPIRLSSGEQFAVRSSSSPAGSGGPVQVHIHGNVYGVNDLEGTIQHALDRHDRGLR